LRGIAPHLHEKVYGGGEGGYRLGLSIGTPLCGTNMLHISIPVLFADETCGVRGAAEGGVMEHDDHIIFGNVNIYYDVD
jgi:hypothetical protein